MDNKWIAQWKVKSSTGKGSYTVSLGHDGKYACSCMAWTRNMPRKDCKHITEVRAITNLKPMNISKKKAKYFLANVRKPIYKAKTNELLVPLIRLPDTILMEATIVFSMYKHGWTWEEIKEQRRLPKEWTLSAVINHVQKNGPAEYPPDKRRK
jgi:hypothetical protein